MESKAGLHHTIATPCVGRREGEREGRKEGKKDEKKKQEAGDIAHLVEQLPSMWAQSSIPSIN